MKRGIVNGFDGITENETAKRIKNWIKNQPSGRWRSIKQIRIKYTYKHSIRKKILIHKNSFILWVR